MKRNPELIKLQREFESLPLYLLNKFIVREKVNLGVNLKRAGLGVYLDS